MGSVADCFDHALAQSVFATLQCELFDAQPGGRFATHQQAKLAIFDYLEAFYNPDAVTARWACAPPAQFERAHPQSAQHGRQAAA